MQRLPRKQTLLPAILSKCPPNNVGGFLKSFIIHPGQAGRPAKIAELEAAGRRPVRVIDQPLYMRQEFVCRDFSTPDDDGHANFAVDAISDAHIPHRQPDNRPYLFNSTLPA